MGLQSEDWKKRLRFGLLHTIASTGARSTESEGTVGENAWSEVIQNLKIFANATEHCSTNFYEVFKGFAVVILDRGHLHLKLIYQGRLWRGFPGPSCPRRRFRHRRRLCTIFVSRDFNFYSFNFLLWFD